MRVNPALEWRGPLSTIRLRSQETHPIASDAQPEALDEFDLVLAPGHLIRRAEQVHTALWGEVVGQQITSVQFAILLAIEADPGIDQRTVGERVSLDASTLAEISRRLVARELVDRERDGRDARRYSLRLTRQGKKLIRDTTPAAEEVGRRLLAELSTEERQQLLRLLARVAGVAEP